MILSRYSVRSFTQGLIPARIAPAEYSQRRDRLVELVRKRVPGRSAVVLLEGAKTTYSAPDVPHVFRQCSHFRYITGISVPGCSYLIHIPAEGKARSILLMNHRTPYEKLWEGDIPSDSELEKTAGFDDIVALKDSLQIIQKFSSCNSVLFAENDCWKLTTIPLKDIFHIYMGTFSLIDSLRLYKSDAEIQSMRDVCLKGSQMMTSTIAGSRGFASESAITGLLYYEAKRRGADDFAYPPVVAAGYRANTIHYLESNKAINMGDCMLVDAGCDLNGYVSDITRCWPISGEWTDSQRVLYEALRCVHEELLTYANSMEQVKLSSLFTRMIELLAATLSEAGVLPRNVENAKLLQLCEQICPHHVSHYLGMDVHDCTSVSRDIPLDANAVFTIEPGVYVPHSMTVVPEEFRGIGFRIEDDIAIRPKGGIEVLSNVCRSADDIEYLMNPS